MGRHGPRGPSRDGLGVGRFALGALARRPTRTPTRRCRSGCALVQGMVRDFLDRVPTGAWRPDPDREHVRRAGARRHRRGGDAIRGGPRSRRCSSSSIRDWSPSPATGRRPSGVADQVRIEEGDASLCRWYEAQVPADLVLVCGVFGNISSADITRTIQALRGFCRRGSEVIWTRHRRPPDATPSHPGRFRRRRVRGGRLRGSRRLRALGRPASLRRRSRGTSIRRRSSSTSSATVSCPHERARGGRAGGPRRPVEPAARSRRRDRAARTAAGAFVCAGGPTTARSRLSGATIRTAIRCIPSSCCPWPGGRPGSSRPVSSSPPW